MAGIIILCVVALLLCVVLTTPIHVRAAYDQGEISAGLRYGPLKIPLYPGKGKPEGEAKDRKKAKKKKKTAEEEPGGEAAEKKKGFRVNRAQILYSMEKLPPILGKALRRTGRRLRFRPLKLHLLVAGADPADTAVLYGKLEAAFAAGLPALHRLVRIEGQDIRLFLDFQREEMDCIADVGVSIRIWDLAVIGLCAGAGLLKWLAGFRRLADPPKEEKPPRSSGRETDPARPEAAG